MSCLLIVLFVSASFLIYQRQRTLVLKVAVDNARNMARQIIETRDYISSVEHGEAEHNYSLVPQVVATQIAAKMTRDSKFYVRQVSLRYRNPGNRPDEYETEQLQRFSGRVVHENYRIVNSERGESFRYMQSMVAEKSCLTCHGSYDSAPLFIRKRFPRGHYSYDYKLGEVIGAVSVTVPMEELYRDIGTNLKLDLAYRALVFFIIIVIMAALLRRIIIHPIRMLSESITKVTRTDTFIPLPKTSDDEIGNLISAFNDMMDELGRKTAQSRESEQRYREFIEVSRSSVITFLADGKIVITNQKAEEMLGSSRLELLGENIYGFFLEGERLKQEVSFFLEEIRKGKRAPGTTLHVVRDATGGEHRVEVALSATQTDLQPMITVILRDVERR
jgi:PAS domain S-box-containing protein